jgi:superfamily I DNA and RNA helicase
MQFLKETTADFDHFVIITQDTDYNIFESRILKVLPKGYYNKLNVHGQQGEFTAHLEGCNEFLQYYYNHPEYDHLLILDSDCWPIREGWQELLVEKMEHYQYAAPIQMENFDMYPHPSAFFLRDRNCGISFTPDKWVTNMIGQRFIDVGTSIDLQWCYPLVRSNACNPHPIFAGIYSDMFYHHGGSNRATTKGYFDHYVRTTITEENLYSQLKNNARGFVNSLRGIV